MPQAILTAAQQCGFLILLFEFSSLRYYVYMERAEWIFHASTECLINWSSSLYSRKCILANSHLCDENMDVNTEGGQCI